MDRPYRYCRGESIRSFLSRVRSQPRLTTPAVKDYCLTCWQPSFSTKGTKRRNKSALYDELERTGASIAFSSGGDRLDFQVRCLARDLQATLALVTEQVAEPALLDESWPWSKGERQLIWRVRQVIRFTCVETGFHEPSIRKIIHHISQHFPM